MGAATFSYRSNCTMHLYELYRFHAILIFQRNMPIDLRRARLTDAELSAIEGLKRLVVERQCQILKRKDWTMIRAEITRTNFKLYSLDVRDKIVISRSMIDMSWTKRDENECYRMMKHLFREGYIDNRDTFSIEQWDFLINICPKATVIRDVVRRKSFDRFDIIKHCRRWMQMSKQS